MIVVKGKPCVSYHPPKDLDGEEDYVIYLKNIEIRCTFASPDGTVSSDLELDMIEPDEERRQNNDKFEGMVRVRCDDCSRLVKRAGQKYWCYSLGLPKLLTYRQTRYPRYCLRFTDEMEG